MICQGYIEALGDANAIRNIQPTLSYLSFLSNTKILQQLLISMFRQLFYREPTKLCNDNFSIPGRSSVNCYNDSAKPTLSPSSLTYSYSYKHSVPLDVTGSFFSLSSSTFPVAIATYLPTYLLYLLLTS